MKGLQKNAWDKRVVCLKGGVEKNIIEEETMGHIKMKQTYNFAGGDIVANMSSTKSERATGSDISKQPASSDT